MHTGPICDPTRQTKSFNPVRFFPPTEKNTKIGALIVFDVVDASEAERFNAGDPFIIHGVYDRVELLRWDRTIG